MSKRRTYRIEEIGSDFGDAPFGSALKSKDYTTSGVPVIQGRNIKNNRFNWNQKLYVSEEKFASLKRSHCREGDLVFPKIGTVGVAAILPKVEGRNTFLLSTNMMKMSVNKAIADIKYVYYFFCQSHVREYIRATAGGSSQPIFNFTTLKNFEIELPDLREQLQVASILSAYDDLIENNTRRIQILEEMARRIYEEWFVSFRFPGHENVRMVESELGLVPEGWKLKRLGEVLELVYGKALKADEREEGNIPVYGSSGIVGFHCVPLVDAAGIIVGRKGNVGSVHLSDVPFYPIDTVYYIKTELPLSYVFFNLKRQNFINNDAAVPGLNRNQARSLPFILPADNLVNRFDALVQNLFGLSRKLQTKNANLRRTRDLLLPKLISGEIDVSNVPEPVTD